MFVHVNNSIYNTDAIIELDCSRFISEGLVKMVLPNNRYEWAEGAEATTLIMSVCPSFLEGKEAKYTRYAWSVHNIIGHPLMQICSWFHMTELGIRIHDATVPTPIENK
jgi:hypothetical protein